MADPWSVLSAHQQAVAREFLDARERERIASRDLPVGRARVRLSVARQRPRSQVRARRADRARSSGSTPTKAAASCTEIVDGVELDYSSNELGLALRGAIKGNGNFLERLLGEFVLDGDPALLAEARVMIRPLLSRRVAQHYRGFARSQLHAFDESPTAKRALYVVRTAATGRHVLAHGDVVTDVARLGAFVPAELDELLVIKRTGERSVLPPEVAAQWRARLITIIAAIDPASSILPPIRPTTRSPPPTRGCASCATSGGDPVQLLVAARLEVARDRVCLATARRARDLRLDAVVVGAHYHERVACRRRDRYAVRLRPQ